MEISLMHLLEPDLAELEELKNELNLSKSIIFLKLALSKDHNHSEMEVAQTLKERIEENFKETNQ